MDIEIKQIFGKRVKELRNKLNLSQKDFAAAIDLAASYLPEIESGKIKPAFKTFVHGQVFVNGAFYGVSFE